jgi:pentapeptide MXKDX repeat protein
MHKDVIESERYPEIVFRPDRADGVLAKSGASTLQVHGRFAIHGTEHEVTFPVAVSFAGSAWIAKASFQVPYVRWGMKNPSKLFLKVDDVVQVLFGALAFAQSGDAMKQDDMKNDQMKNDQMKNDQMKDDQKKSGDNMKKDDVAKDSSKKQKKSKKTKKDAMQKDEMKHDDGMKH